MSAREAELRYHLGVLEGCRRQYLAASELLGLRASEWVGVAPETDGLDLDEAIRRARVARATCAGLVRARREVARDLGLLQGDPAGTDECCGG